MIGWVTLRLISTPFRGLIATMGMMCSSSVFAARGFRDE